MSLCSCNFKCSCTLCAIIASVIIGVITTFLQITAVITVAPVFLWVTFGIAIVYLGILVISAALVQRTDSCGGMCTALNALLLGILGTILLAVILLAVGIVATSLLSAILIGLLLFFFTLMLTSTACIVKCFTVCTE